jgi:hypothetical protein
MAHRLSDLVTSPPNSASQSTLPSPTTHAARVPTRRVPIGPRQFDRAPILSLHKILNNLYGVG